MNASSDERGRFAGYLGSRRLVLLDAPMTFDSWKSTRDGKLISTRFRHSVFMLVNDKSIFRNARFQTDTVLRY